MMTDLDRGELLHRLELLALRCRELELRIGTARLDAVTIRRTTSDMWIEQEAAELGDELASNVIAATGLTAEIKKLLEAAKRILED